jgi:inosine/xanthosine triphosphate pyrophosphatase family protein
MQCEDCGAETKILQAVSMGLIVEPTTRRGFEYDTHFVCANCATKLRKELKEKQKNGKDCRLAPVEVHDGVQVPSVS